ncbi:MAG: hypothetical protein AB2L14_25815 [Candidatus Xenobiia bacterium LiM19]
MYAHRYGNKESRITKAKVHAFYLVPKERKPSLHWNSKIEALLENMRLFHEREFKGLSSVCFRLHHEPVVGRKITSEYRDEKHCSYYEEMSRQVMEYERPEGEFDYHSYAVFVDWGKVDNEDGNGCDTYVGKRNDKTLDVSDILQLHGCCGGSWCEKYGSAIITEEAWKHPEIEGTDIVVYHECLGHPLGMPHTKSEKGVMGFGQYAHITLEESYLEQEIISNMVVFSPDEAEKVSHLFSWI